MTELELAAADVWATGISPDSYPTQFLREDLDAIGVVPADQLLAVPDGTRVLVAGAVTHRQRPATAQGVTFINLEDETGMVNVLCSPGVWARHRRLAQTGISATDPRSGAERHRCGHRRRRPDGQAFHDRRIEEPRLPLSASRRVPDTPRKCSPLPSQLACGPNSRRNVSPRSASSRPCRR
jgi:hypothetical protein